MRILLTRKILNSAAHDHFISRKMLKSTLAFDFVCVHAKQSNEY
jgi:hypothetical protein